MLKWLKRWLGWDSESSLFDFSDLRDRPPSRPLPPIVPRNPTSAPKSTAARTPKPAARPKAKERLPIDVLDNPRLTLDKPADDGFDPYNTGAFNRSASWEKIGRQRKR